MGLIFWHWYIYLSRDNWVAGKLYHRQVYADRHTSSTGSFKKITFAFSLKCSFKCASSVDFPDPIFLNSTKIQKAGYLRGYLTTFCKISFDNRDATTPHTVFSCLYNFWWAIDWAVSKLSHPSIEITLKVFPPFREINGDPGLLLPSLEVVNDRSESILKRRKS